jgi:2-oxoglutarate ferredoxin oxidoreductase subunit delta
MKGKIIIDAALCKGCGYCIAFCPKSVIRASQTMNAKGYAFAEPDPEKSCTGCATCAVVCPEAAIEVYRE